MMKALIIIIGAWLMLLIARVPASRNYIVRTAKNFVNKAASLFVKVKNKAASLFVKVKNEVALVTVFGVSIYATLSLTEAYILPLIEDKSIELQMCVSFTLPVFVSYILILAWKYKNGDRDKLARLITDTVFPICTGVALIFASIIVPLCLPDYAEVANGVRSGMALITAIDKVVVAAFVKNAK